LFRPRRRPPAYGTECPFPAGARTVTTTPGCPERLRRPARPRRKTLRRPPSRKQIVTSHVSMWDRGSNGAARRYRIRGRRRAPPCAPQHHVPASHLDELQHRQTMSDPCLAIPNLRAVDLRPGGNGFATRGLLDSRARLARLLHHVIVESAPIFNLSSGDPPSPSLHTTRGGPPLDFRRLRALARHTSPQYQVGPSSQALVVGHVNVGPPRSVSRASPPSGLPFRHVPWPRIDVDRFVAAASWFLTVDPREPSAW